MIVASWSSNDIPSKVLNESFGGMGGTVTLGANGTDV
jgi:hypothetical protein